MFIDGQVLMWERLELMIGRHAANVVNGSGMRKSAVKLREVLNPGTYRRLRVQEQAAADAVLSDADEYWLTGDGVELEELLAEVGEDQ